MKKYFNIILLSILLISCSKDYPDSPEKENLNSNVFYYGADLSYVNEMEECGAVYKDFNGNDKDPYKIFSEAGTNIVRIRLWHNPKWTNYSNINDVKKSIERAKSEGIQVLLDFHYSDTWADPSQQEIPSAWLDQINNTNVLGDLLYNYTFDTLNDLANSNLLPDIVQVGNEINAMILQNGEVKWPIDWIRNSSLINKGIKAIRDIASLKNKKIEIMLHIAQPENGLWWFEQANAAGITDYDWIGLSYYPQWSDYDLNSINVPIKTLIETYDKRLMIVETAYPFTLENVDNANNILNEDALISGFPASQQGQLDYLNALKAKIFESGGEGVIYWEPAWVSTSCSTLWASGSHWDNATLFDHNNKSNLGMQFYNASKN
ncbi:arabinogalactan endo-1,4-beta-galactosidase [Flavobacteriaceae bacterium]|jgi:arabinogalactan endo-1,4-beta-galactosidase|nr:arabinogalactan endo-1,4-beta-galactosidase [Flavobacteriaceae bacterium]MDA9338857.1 arabinogalactan endo-1,4-beta-galactosidase [Flavobacteriaceae bacterium]MDB4098088.1 arabinogalactan endo-1,4-beta-galactosidase [Flavobacteriaceae bacterium]MDB4113671.1 arabinogalactan endo-1,4-beta-galactosidase [Flavobacteriaceae bacterium]